MRQSFTETVPVIDVVSEPFAYEWIRAKTFADGGSGGWLPYFAGGCHA